MKKDLKVTSQEDIAIIVNTLRDILKLYSSYTKSDLYNITIDIHNGLTIIIKMLNPFANGTSYFIVGYVSNGEDDQSKVIFVNLISLDDEESYNNSVELAVYQISMAINQAIDETTDTITIYHNLDEKRPKSAFILVGECNYLRDKKYMDDVKCDIASYIASNLSSSSDKMILQLYIHLNKNTKDEIKSSIRCYFQYVRVFNIDYYFIRLKTFVDGDNDQVKLYTSADNFIKGIKSIIDIFYNISSYTIDGEVAKISLFKESWRTKHV